MGNYEKAISDFSHAIDLNGNNIWNLTCRGETYWMINEFKAALADFNQAIEINEDYAPALALRASTFLSIGDIESAKIDNEKLISQEPRGSQDYYYRAAALVLSNEYPEAITMLEKACEDRISRTYAQTDKLFNPIRELPEFKNIFKSP